MKIKEYSIPRSGSTFIYQILKELFEDVLLTHHYEEGINIIVYRNFLDSIMSHYRVIYEKPDDFIITEKEEIDEAINLDIEFMNQIFLFENELEDKLILSYENDIFLPDGKNNYKNIFNKFEEFFNIEINNKKEIIENTNFQKNKVRSFEYKNFDKYNLKTKIHGKHVVDGQIGSWKKHIDPNLHDYYLKSIANDNYNKWLYILEKNGK